MGTVSFGRLASQGGKTYVPMAVDVPEGGSIVASARTTGAHAVPAKVLRPWGRRECVLVLPSLLATARASVMVRDAEGLPVAQTSLMVRPSLAFLTSTYNRTRCADEVGWYLGLDERPCGDATYVEFERLFTDFETTDVLHGTIEVPGSDRAALARPLETRLIDVFGRPIDGLPALVTLRDDIVGQSDGTFLRRLRFSQTIPRGLRSLTLWIRHPDHRIPDGFLTLDAPTLAAARETDLGFRRDRSDGVGYHDWYVHNQQTSALDLELARRRGTGGLPRVSLLIDLAPLDPVGLEETLRSLEDQSHGDWELVGYGDVGPDGAHRWRGRAWEGPRGEGVLPPMSPAEALQETSGELVGVIGMGDTLEPDALQSLAEAFAGAEGNVGDGEGPALVFCDQDLRAWGDAGHAYYLQGMPKSPFDRDLLYAKGATGRLTLVRRSCLGASDLAGRDARGLALDLEVALAAVERGGEVVHVPRLLYHGLAREGSWLATETAPPVGTAEAEACEQVLRAHLEREGIRATVAPNESAGTGRLVDYEVGAGDDQPLVSIVIPNKDSVEVLARCLDSIRSLSAYRRYEVVIVENNSTEPGTFAYYDSLAGDAAVEVVRYEGDFNFSAICNFGARAARGEHLLFLNNDTEVIEPRWIELLLGPLLRGDVGCTGAHLYFPDGLLQHGGVAILPEGPDHLEHYVPPAYDAYQGLSRHHTHQAMAVTGACLMVPRAVFDEVGGFDESLPINFNDIQFCLAVREAGYGVVYEPRARLWHYESYSRGLHRDDVLREIRLASEKGETMLRWSRLYAEGDPYYDHRYAYHNLYYTLGWSPSLKAVED